MPGIESAALYMQNRCSASSLPLPATWIRILEASLQPASFASSKCSRLIAHKDDRLPSCVLVPTLAALHNQEYLKNLFSLTPLPMHRLNFVIRVVLCLATDLLCTFSVQWSELTLRSTDSHHYWQFQRMSDYVYMVYCFLCLLTWQVLYNMF